MEQIRLSNAAFEGDNNVYLFDGDETVLVDTGDPLAETRERLSGALGRYGFGFADVDRVLLTHWHGDHAGLAGAIQRAGGATVHVHEADAALVAGDPDAWARLRERHEACFEHWGIPEADRQRLRTVLENYPDPENSPDVTPLQDGDEFTLEGRRVEAVHAPGHAAGLCLYDLGETVLTGDALLPNYTPNVGGADVRVEEPLDTYLGSLRRIGTRGYDRAWPGHRNVVDNPTERAAEIRHHHRERAWRVLDALRRLGPTDVWSVSADLFGSLDGIHILHGPGEVHAHLRHLHDTGSVRREQDRYRLADGVASQLDAGGVDEWPLR